MTSRATSGVRLFVLAVTVSLAVGVAHAEEMSLEERRERFELFNYCLPMRLIVEGLGSDLCGVATTWVRGSAGTHGGDAGYIRSGVSEYMDTFLLEYLRVNEEACPGN